MIPTRTMLPAGLSGAVSRCWAEECIDALRRRQEAGEGKKVM